MVAACSKDEKITYYPDYHLSVVVTSSKQSFLFNNENVSTSSLEFKYKEKQTGDILSVDLGCAPVLLIDSIVTIKDSIFFDTSTNSYDTITLRTVQNIFDTTLYDIKYLHNGNVLQSENGYSTGYQNYKSIYIIK